MTDDDTIRDVQLRADEILERKRAAAEEMYAALKAQEAVHQQGLVYRDNATREEYETWQREFDRLAGVARALRTAALAKAEGREAFNG